MRNRDSSSKRIIAAAVLLALPASVGAATFAYDFDSGQVSGSANPGTPLINGTTAGTIGQDNWILTSGASANVHNEAAPGFSGNWIASPAVSGTTTLDGIMTRYNGSTYGLTTGGQGTFTFDLTVGASGGGTTQFRRAEIAPGVDVNGDNKIRPTAATSENPEIAFMFGYEATGSAWYVRPAAFGTAVQVTATPSGTWRAQLVVDFAANSSNGSGTLYVKQLFDGSGNPVNDVFHVPDPLLANVNLGIQRMATLTGGAPQAADPANWNGLMARTAGNGSLDNIVIDSGVPTGSPQWALNAAGNWNSATNWYPAVAPNAVGAEASFGGIISTDRSIFADTPVTVGTLRMGNTASYVIGGAGTLTLQTSSGSALVDVSAGTQKINLPLIIASNTTLNVASGATLKISDPVTINPGVTVTPTGSGTILYESTVNVLGGGASLAFGSSTRVPSLTIASGGTASLTAGNNKALHADSLSVSGKLDLKDNRLITPSAIGTISGGTYSGVTGLIQSGRNGGDWSGNGIVTSSASGSLTTLGVATASQAKSIAANATTVWNGETVHGSDTLVMYTYGGDANLDGKINVDDYGRIDLNIPLGTSGWYNGDFNYDGKINVDDYGIIDFNVGIQGPPLGGVANSSGLTAVPEPAALAPVLMGTIAMLKPRRRRC